MTLAELAQIKLRLDVDFWARQYLIAREMERGRPTLQPEKR